MLFYQVYWLYLMPACFHCLAIAFWQLLNTRICYMLCYVWPVISTGASKLESHTLLCSVDLFMMIGLVVLKQYYARQTKRRTDRQNQYRSVHSCVMLTRDYYSVKLGTYYPCPRAVFMGRVHRPWTRASLWTRPVNTSVTKWHPCSRAVLVTSISITAREHWRHFSTPVFTGRGHCPWTLPWTRILCIPSLSQGQTKPLPVDD